MDDVQLHHQECREDETEELYPPLSADESTKQPDDARIDYRQGQRQLAFGYFVL